jgi:peptide/nickel transport system substrate-binding protein
MFKISKNFAALVLAIFFAVLSVPGGALGVVKLKTCIEVDIINLDPAHLSSEYDRLVCQHVYEGLVTFDYAAEPPYPIIPALAESYEVSNDAKVITFRLHKGVKFHAGYGELTSQDVVFTLERHQDPKVASRTKSQLADIERVEALDKYTVKIYLKNPAAVSLMQNLAFQNAGYILSKKAATELGDKIQRMPIGTGPFYFDRYEPGEKAVLKKFGDYWGTPSKIDEIEFWIIPEQIVALGALEKGDMDVVPVTAVGGYQRAKAMVDQGKDIYLAESMGGGRQYVAYINHDKKPMDDLRVRRALAHALDMKGIVARLGPLVKYWPSPFAPVAFAATDELWRYEYDLDKAKQLLAEAGYPNGFELIMIYERYALCEQLVLEVKNCWDKIVDVKLQLLDSANYWNVLTQDRPQHIGFWSCARMAPFLFAQHYLSDSPRNYAHYVNPQVDETTQKAITATSEQEARKYWREFQRLVTEDVANLWVCNQKSMCAIKDNVKGVVILPIPNVFDLTKAYTE